MGKKIVAVILLIAMIVFSIVFPIDGASASTYFDSEGKASAFLEADGKCHFRMDLGSEDKKVWTSQVGVTLKGSLNKGSFEVVIKDRESGAEYSRTSYQAGDIETSYVVKADSKGLTMEIIWPEGSVLKLNAEMKQKAPLFKHVFAFL